MPGETYRQLNPTRELCLEVWGRKEDSGSDQGSD